MEKSYRIIASSENRVEEEAKCQMEKAANLPGVVCAVGMPDIHPGKGGPVGVSVMTRDVIYPYLIGGDIGCGMRLSQVARHQKKLKIEQWKKRLLKPVEYDIDLEKEFIRNGLERTKYDEQLGTIGSGNHFAEFLTVEKVFDSKKFNESGLNKDSVYLLIHSGSRRFGNDILREYVDARKDGGCRPGEDAYEKYIDSHHKALLWAKLNRELIAKRLLQKLGTTDATILDIAHNYIESMEHEDGGTTFVHRKGAISAESDLVVIPGSRGTPSYLVEPLKNEAAHGYSLAHGAGRKWNRIKSRQMSRIKYKDKDIRNMKGHSALLTNDRNVMLEEAPEAYKNIKTIIADLEQERLIRVVSCFTPRITYKAEL
ncbi:MAG: RNA ligase RtcB family protein [Leptospirales bacterium]